MTSTSPTTRQPVAPATDTLPRGTQGFTGQPSEPRGGVTGSPSFSSDGNLLAFGSTIANLVYGDGNAPHGETPGLDGSDAFVVQRKVLSPVPAETYISPAPAGAAPAPEWRLGATAHSLRDGAGRLRARGAGPRPPP